MSQSTPARRPQWHTDLEGLRVVAVVLVAVYHVWAGRVSGGVDVFFMLSGFFVGGSLWRRFAAGMPPRPAEYVTRHLRRLLPAAIVVLVATAIGTVLILPQLDGLRLPGGGDETPKHYLELFERLGAAAPVFAVRDNPTLPVDIPECLATEDAGDCDFGLQSLIAPQYPSKALKDSGVMYADATDLICPAMQCHAVIGNRIVYRDTNHLTLTYVETIKVEAAARWAHSLRSLVSLARPGRLSTWLPEVLAVRKRSSVPRMGDLCDIPINASIFKV